MQKIIITGASGVLGSAVLGSFQRSNTGQYAVIGLAHSRVGDGLKQLDLLDKPVVEEFFTEYAPTWVIHCAAERRPDVAEKDNEAARKLNAGVPLHLATLAAKLGFTLVYISTDYVFDGQAPPYSPSAETNPLQFYGKTKRDGELAVLGVNGAKSIVLRVPVLYGPTPKNSDSAVNILIDVVKDQSGKKYNMDHFATRFPTNVEDIADFLVRLVNLNRPIPSILHYSAGEPFTKYEMCLIFAEILKLPHNHIVPETEPPKDATLRPQNTQLDVRETEALFEGSGFEGLGWNGFEEWWTSYLSK